MLNEKAGKCALHQFMFICVFLINFFLNLLQGSDLQTGQHNTGDVIARKFNQMLIPVKDINAALV